MNFKELAITLHTNRMVECVEFYKKYFNATTTFDCGWYIVIKFPSDANPNLLLSFMTPQVEDGKETLGGLTFNLMIDDVDAEYARIKALGANIATEIADQEWGDRSFRMLDPLGNVVYIYSPREISDKYKDAVKE